MPRTKDMKDTNEPRLLTGSVKSLHQQKGFGFILGDDGAEYFFHRSSAGDFDSLTLGTEVHFIALIGPKGPRAEQVEVV